MAAERRLESVVRERIITIAAAGQTTTEAAVAGEVGITGIDTGTGAVSGVIVTDDKWGTTSRETRTQDATQYE